MELGLLSEPITHGLDAALSTFPLAATSFSRLAAGGYTDSGLFSSHFADLSSSTSVPASWTRVDTEILSGEGKWNQKVPLRSKVLARAQQSNSYT